MLCRKFRSAACLMLFTGLSLGLAPTGASADNLPELFREPAPLQLTLRGDFIKIRDANAGGNWDDDEHEDEKYWSVAELSDLSQPARHFAARIRARGMSSALEGEGTFPKILVEINKDENLDGTVFKKNRKFRINTHVSTNPTSDYTKMGRLNSEKSPWREALGYDIARAIGMPVLGTRRAIITYTELTTGEVFTRQALLIETDGNLGERLQANKVSLKDFARTAETRIDMEDSALLHLFEALIGNEDFVLRTSNEKPHAQKPGWDYGNVIVFEKSDRSRFVGPYDFDRSTLIGGNGFLDYTEYAPTTVEEVMTRRVGWLRDRHPDTAVRRAAARILNRRDQIEAAIRQAIVDEEGRAIALSHLERYEKYLKEILVRHHFGLSRTSTAGTPLGND